MKKIFLITVLFIAFGDVRAQVGSEKETFEFYEVDKRAEYKGGLQEMNIFIMENLNYPISAMECECEGKVIIEFVVYKTGKVGAVRVINTIVDCAGPPKPKKSKKKNTTPADCDQAKEVMEQESIRVIEAMPDWNPATQRGKPVNMKFRLPLQFKLV